jgi:hypothetical protein
MSGKFWPTSIIQTSPVDGGTTEDAVPCFVMEFIAGQPIDEYCNNHKLPTSERLTTEETDVATPVPDTSGGCDCPLVL